MIDQQPQIATVSSLSANARPQDSRDAVNVRIWFERLPVDVLVPVSIPSNAFPGSVVPSVQTTKVTSTAELWMSGTTPQLTDVLRVDAAQSMENVIHVDRYAVQGIELIELGNTGNGLFRNDSTPSPGYYYGSVSLFFGGDTASQAFCTTLLSTVGAMYKVKFSFGREDETDFIPTYEGSVVKPKLHLTAVGIQVVYEFCDLVCTSTRAYGDVPISTIARTVYAKRGEPAYAVFLRIADLFKWDYTDTIDGKPVDLVEREALAHPALKDATERTNVAFDDELLRKYTLTGNVVKDLVYRGDIPPQDWITQVLCSAAVTPRGTPYVFASCPGVSGKNVVRFHGSDYDPYRGTTYAKVAKKDLPVLRFGAGAFDSEIISATVDDETLSAMLLAAASYTGSDAVGGIPIHVGAPSQGAGLKTPISQGRMHARSSRSVEELQVKVAQSLADLGTGLRINITMRGTHRYRLLDYVRFIYYMADYTPLPGICENTFQVTQVRHTLDNSGHTTALEIVSVRAPENASSTTVDEVVEEAKKEVIYDIAKPMFNDALGTVTPGGSRTRAAIQ